MELIHVPPKDLKVSPFCLRPVKRDSAEYLQLRESIKKTGLDMPLLIRQRNEVVDGHSRREAAIDLRLESVGCILTTLSDFEVLVKQLQLNDVPKMVYAGRLWRIMQQRPEMTLDELSHTVMRTREWLCGVLNLGTLVDMESVQRGELPILVAAELAKLPEDYQKELISLNKVLTIRELVDMIRVSVRKYLESLKDTRALRNLRNVQEIRPRFRPIAEVRREVDNPSAAALVLNRLKAETAWQGWQACLRWVLSVDPASLDRRLASLERLQGKQAQNSNGLVQNEEPLDKDTEH